MELGPILAAFVGAIAGSVLKGVWDRSLAKKAPKTERRAEAYKDFATYFAFYVSASEDARRAVAPLNLDEINSRLILFGESEVVNEAANFLATHQSLDADDAKEDFVKVVRAMRGSIATGNGDEVMGNVKTILYLLNSKFPR